MSQINSKYVDSDNDIPGIDHSDLTPFFSPQNVTLIGASEEVGSVGHTLLRNLVNSAYEGTIFPVNPNYESIMGIKAYPQVTSLPNIPELAIIATPAPTVPEIVRQCGKAGCQAAIIVSAGFKETGQEGLELEQEILREARQANLRIVGPNCLGVMNTQTDLNATFANNMAHSGSVAFLSQSGALCTAILDWSLQEQVGFSKFVSVGSMVDVGWADLIRYLGDDPQTQSIVIYMETIGNASAFVSAARQVAPFKPIIVIKPGRTEGAAQAAASHTGSLTGSDEVLETAFQRCGVIRVDSISDVFNISEVLSKQPIPQGHRLTILTNAGGPGVLATDALILGGGELSELSQDTLTSLDEFLPKAWSHDNPVDILGDADPQRYSQAVEITAQDTDSDGLLVILTPQAMTNPTATAEVLKPYAQRFDKPILASWMGGKEIEHGEALLNLAGISTFAYPDTAARIFNYMASYADNLHNLYEIPSLDRETDKNQPNRDQVEEIISTAREGGRTILTEFETKQILQAYHIPTVSTQVAESEDQAVEIAAQLSYPVVLKLHSKTITHKSDVGGVQLNLHDGEAVRSAYRDIRDGVSKKADQTDFGGVTVQTMINLDGYELIVGSSHDAQFGPVMLFGRGGELVEVYRDQALALPPLNVALARSLISKPQIYQALKGVRGKPPVDLQCLTELLVLFSQLIIEQPALKELEINPLLASSDQILALDARAILYGAEQKPVSPPAIQPYPSHYCRNWKMQDGTVVKIRPIRPKDEISLERFYQALSQDDQDFLETISNRKRNVNGNYTRLCFPDYVHEIVFIAERQESKSSKGMILAIAMLSQIRCTSGTCFNVIVSENYRNFGLGSELLHQSLNFGREKGFQNIVANVSADNGPMLHILKKFDFKSQPTQNNDHIHAVKQLS